MFLHTDGMNDFRFLKPVLKLIPWYHVPVPPPDPQAYSMKPESDSMPTIQVDLASPQSPDSVNVMDEFRRAKREEEEEERGLMMKPPPGQGGPTKPGEEDASRDAQKLTRCLSDPGPSADEEEDEPFLP